MISTPLTRLADDMLAEPATSAPVPRAGVRVVTAAQVDQAVIQLRERRGQNAAEQVQAVLRAFQLTVAPEPEIPTPR